METSAVKEQRDYWQVGFLVFAECPECGLEKTTTNTATTPVADRVFTCWNCGTRWRVVPRNA